jgi:hypothetical protein
MIFTANHLILVTKIKPSRPLDLPIKRTFQRLVSLSKNKQKTHNKWIVLNQFVKMLSSKLHWQTNAFKLSLSRKSI